MRFGISTIDGILLKSFRTRRPHAILPAIHPPRPGRWGLRSTHPGGAWDDTLAPRRDVLGLEGTPTLGAPVSDREERRCYFTSTAPPTSSSFFLMSAASTLVIFSFTAFG